MSITETQAYSLLSMLSTTGTIAAVIERVRKHNPKLVRESRKFLDLYDKYHDRKEFRHGNGYVDVSAFKRACMMFAKAEGAK